MVSTSSDILDSEVTFLEMRSAWTKQEQTKRKSGADRVYNTYPVNLPNDNALPFPSTPLN